MIKASLSLVWLIEKQEINLMSIGTNRSVDVQNVGSNSERGAATLQRTLAEESSGSALTLENGTGDSRKRVNVPQLSQAPPKVKDWRESLPCGNFDAGDLGEAPGGWMFCRERAL
jgi:hypothetical protein